MDWDIDFMWCHKLTCLVSKDSTLLNFFVWIYNGILIYRCEQKAILTLYGWNCRIIYIFEPYFPTFCQKELIPFSATMLPFVTAGIFMAYALFLGVWLWLCILMRQLWGTESGRYNYDKNDFSTFTDLKGNFIDLLIMYTFIFQELSWSCVHMRPTQFKTLSFRNLVYTA